jgi:hypothetical protein
MEMWCDESGHELHDERAAVVSLVISELPGGVQITNKNICVNMELWAFVASPHRPFLLSALIRSSCSIRSSTPSAPTAFFGSISHSSSWIL